MIEDALDTVKTTAYQIDSFSQVSKDLAHFVRGLGAWTEKVEGFFSRPGNAALVAAGIIALAVATGYLRARLVLLSRRLSPFPSLVMRRGGRARSCRHRRGPGRSS
jgi:hypothetical protein